MVGEVESYGIHGRDTEQNPVSEIKEGLENSLEVQGFPCGSAGKESTCNVGDLGLIPELGRSPGEEKGYLFQYSGLENSMDYIIHGVTKSETPLSHFHFIQRTM